ncbi:hypothetical protein ULMS_21290 [Patiriisocius marinistellae]|uniref:Uncharacterized protein n=1 Tax=Patiriisocius marinistellae TaxID=2494560 RepID=A0A5J4G2Y9_9FLAO|nr:carboxypeptidase-like regulatory domain-containing protein [Patiriisocius marinistellae]GEQ86621.1 hypothetical protein ULMS_21290 [Patiriisocius marinistellae]
MKKTILVKIPKPCHEDWKKMTLTEKGRHCASCEKEVTDFTQKSDEQIFKILKENPNSCGRFKKTQLNREIILQRKSTTSLAPYAASLLLPLTLLGSLNSKASSKENKTESVYKSIGIGKFSDTTIPSKAVNLTIGVVTDGFGNAIKNVKITSIETGVVSYTNYKGEYKITCNHGETLLFEAANFDPSKIIIKNQNKIKNVSLNKNQALIKISGTVTDSSGLPLPGVNIIVKGTTSGTQSDFDGLYNINAEEGQSLVFSYVGFDNVEKVISEHSKTINLMMEENITGGFYTVGLIISEPSGPSIMPFGNISFAYDYERDAIKKKQRDAYENGLKFKRRKWREKREARKLKRKQRKEKRFEKLKNKSRN